MYQIIKDYKENAELRASFNRLAEKTFGLNFEGWYQNGYWREKYNPYSIVIDGEVVANVSVNIMDMLWEGEMRHLLQLGTVMTDERYRKQGLIREIMKAIDEDYLDKVDGMYLWGNDNVVTFYPRFGFQGSSEYQYFKSVNITNEATVKPLPMKTKEDWKLLEKAIAGNQCYSRLDMTENIELFMFYVTQFMQDTVYYEETLGAYIIAEAEEEELLLHGIFADREVSAEDVVQAFGKDIRKVVLGFTPSDTAGYDCVKVQEEDCNFFVRGRIFEDFSDRKLRFPTLSHA